MAETFEDCLKQFIKLVDDLNAEDDTGGNGYWREFMKLRELQKANKEGGHFLAEAGKKSVNIKKNRFKDIIPFDASRVILSPIDGVEDSDYINASFIKDIHGKKGYIAAQGPLPNTIHDFWRMLLQYNIEIVFMACLVQEDGKRKCEKYWPDVGQTQEYGNITVKLVSENEIARDFVKRILTAECDGKVHHVTQFQYLGWADHGIPRTPSEIRMIIGKMREARTSDDTPLVIHCSAGCGRTGTICAVDYVWNLLLYRRISDGFNLFDIIKDIREQRQSMVQTPDQYELVHLVVKDLCEEMLKDSEAEYVNINYEDPYVNTVITGEPNADEDLYTEVEVTRPESSEIKAEKVVEKPFLKPKPSAGSEQKPTAPEAKPRVQITLPSVQKPVTAAPKDSYVNVLAQNTGPKFKTVIAVNVKKDDVKPKTSHPTQPAKTSTTQAVSKSGHLVNTISPVIVQAQPVKASQPTAYVSDNVYSKVEHGKTVPASAASASSQESAKQVDYSAVEFKKKDLPLFVAEQNRSNIATALRPESYENQVFSNTSYENLVLPAANLKSAAPVSATNLEEEDAPAIPDRKYNPQEICSPLPTSGVQVMNVQAAKSAGVRGQPTQVKGQPVQVKSQPVQVKSQPVQVKSQPVQVISSNECQTKGTGGVKIHSNGGYPGASAPGSHGDKKSDVHIVHAAPSHRPLFDKINRLSGSLRRTSPTERKSQYDNVAIQSGPKKGFVQTLLSARDIPYSNKGTLSHVKCFESSDIGFPKRLAKPRGERPMPQSWVKTNPH